MRLPKISLFKSLSLLNFILFAVLALDFLILPKKEVIEVPLYQDLVTSRTSVSRSYNGFIITTQKGNEYNLPESLYGSIPADSAFVIAKTNLLRIPANIFFISQGDWYAAPIGHFNSHFLIQLLLALVLFVSVWMLFKKETNHDFPHKVMMLYIFFYLLLIFVVGIS